MWLNLPIECHSLELAYAAHQWYVIVQSLVHSSLQIGQIVVTIATQLEAQGPVGRHHRSSNQLQEQYH